MFKNRIESETDDSSNSQIAVFEDKETSILNKEIQKLNNELHSENIKLMEIRKLISDFGIIHNKELGEIIGKILKLKRDILKQKLHSDRGENSEYYNAQNEYENYYKDCEEYRDKKQYKITDEDRKELKAMYRKATKYCHPDIVHELLKKDAEDMFNSLQEAYQQNDLKKVSDILVYLESNKHMRMDTKTQNTKEALNLRIQALKLKLEEIKKEIFKLESSEAYRTITIIDDWDKYFLETKQKLSEKFETLNNLT